MRKYLFIIVVCLYSNPTKAQYTYRGQVFSAITHEPIPFGSVRLPSPKGTGRHGEKLGKIDSLGFFSFSLKDTSNIWIVVDCVLAGRKFQRVYFTDSIMKVFVKTECKDYNVEQAKKDIEKNEIYILCQLGYTTYEFTGADSAFEKKYGVKYHTFCDTPIGYDCMWLYNKTLAEYLDVKFGKDWRKEIRWDVPLP